MGYHLNHIDKYAHMWCDVIFVDENLAKMWDGLIKDGVRVCVVLVGLNFYRNAFWICGICCRTTKHRFFHMHIPKWVNKRIRQNPPATDGKLLLCGPIWHLKNAMFISRSPEMGLQCKSIDDCIACNILHAVVCIPYAHYLYSDCI